MNARAKSVSMITAGERLRIFFGSMTQFRTTNKVIYQPESTEFTLLGHDELPARGEWKEAF